MRPAWYDDKLRAYAPLIRKLARSIDRQNADDVAQDITIKALLRWKIYNDFFSFPTWLRTLARSEGYHRHRAANNLKRGAKVVELTEYNGGVTQPDQQSKAELAEVLRLLEGRDGEALLRHAMGEDMKDIAAEFGVGRSRVGQLIERGRKRLRDATEYAEGEAA